MHMDFPARFFAGQRGGQCAAPTHFKGSALRVWCFQSLIDQSWQANHNREGGGNLEVRASIQDDLNENQSCENQGAQAEQHAAEQEHLF